MNWTTVGTILKLDIDWQFTEPTLGIFFRFLHEFYPANAIYEIAQVELNDDGSYTLFDSQVLTVERGFTDTIKLAPPGIFTQRRLALRRIPARPTFEQEIRRLLLPGYLQSTDIPPAVTARNRWQVQIESSDYAEPVATVDLTPIQTKLDVINAKIDSFQNSGGSSPPASSTAKTLTYVSDGDANGVCYWIGTNYGAEVWQNPHTAKRLICSISSSFDGNDPPGNLVDRQPSDRPATQNIAGSSMVLDLLESKLKCNRYSIRGRNFDSYHLRNWKVLVGNNLSNLIEIDSQSNNSVINQNIWFSKAVLSPDFYRYIKIEQTGVNSSGDNLMSLGEWEFYGEFIK